MWRTAGVSLQSLQVDAQGRLGVRHGLCSTQSLLPETLNPKSHLLSTRCCAQKLLEEGAYQTPDAARAAGARKQSLEVVARSIGREPPVTYHVTDRAPDKASKDWERVVAVFVTGAAWQFKGWPFKARP